MKSNGVKYALIVIVAVIYGKIFLDVSDIVGSDEPQFQETEELVLTDNKVVIDSVYKLKVDYSDPFLKNSYRKKTVVVKPNNRINPTKKVVTPIAKPVKKPKISYKGLVKNNSSSKKSGLIVIDGKSFMVSEGGKYKDITVVSFDNGKLEYLFGGVLGFVEK